MYLLLCPIFQLYNLISCTTIYLNALFNQILIALFCSTITRFMFFSKFIPHITIQYIALIQTPLESMLKASCTCNFKKQIM